MFVAIVVRTRWTFAQLGTIDSVRVAARPSAGAPRRLMDAKFHRLQPGATASRCRRHEIEHQIDAADVFRGRCRGRRTLRAEVRRSGSPARQAADDVGAGCRRAAAIGRTPAARAMTLALPPCSNSPAMQPGPRSAGLRHRESIARQQRVARLDAIPANAVAEDTSP